MSATIHGVPLGWFSWDYELSDAHGPIATTDLSWLRERAKLSVRGEQYELFRERLLGGRFILAHEGSEVAWAKKPSALQRAFVVEDGQRRYQLEARSVLGRTFLLREGGTVVGSVRPAGIFTRRAMVDFPDDIDLAVRVFMFVLVLILWKRQSDSDATIVTP